MIESKNGSAQSLEKTGMNAGGQVYNRLSPVAQASPTWEKRRRTVDATPNGDRAHLETLGDMDVEERGMACVQDHRESTSAART